MQLHAGYISDGIKQYLTKLNSSVDWKDILYFLSVFELETDQSLNVVNNESLFAVADNIISRGLPTKPSIYLEYILEKTFGRTRRTISKTGEINYELDQNDQNFLKLLKRSFIILDPRIKGIDFNTICYNQSTLEREFYNITLIQTFGEFSQQIFEPQRSLPDIIKFCGNKISKPLCDLAQKFVDANAVDFSIQFPGNNSGKKNGLVIEIDDETHNNPQKRQSDNFRDGTLKNTIVNWSNTVRLRRYGQYLEVNNIPAPKVTEISNFLTHPYCDQLRNNFNNPIYSTLEGLDALQITLSPFGIARIQKTLIQLLRANILRLDHTEWNIAIIERDVPCGKLATDDLMDLLRNLFNLRYENLSLPKINLRIYNTEEFQNAKLNNLVETELYDEFANNIKEFKADILIDVSLLQRPKFTKPSNEFLDKIGNPNVFIIRSCHAPKSERRIAIAPVVNYSPLYDNNQLKSSNLGSLKYFVRNIFRKVGFRSGQLEIINKAMQGQNVIGLLPTGSGKSLCYQICSLMQPGITIIVDPLISLMKDQVQNLENLDITFIDKINSEITSPEERSYRVKRLAKGYNQFVFISPERFQIQEFRDELLNIQNDRKILQVVIDEAHCVSEWGHDFRPAYLHLGNNARNLIDQNVIIFGLTGTASFDVLSDVAREVQINQQGLVEANSFDRKELRFSIQEKRYNINQANSLSKVATLEKILRLIPRYFGYSKTIDFYNEKDQNGFVNCGLIFCPHGKIIYNQNSPFSVGTVHHYADHYLNNDLALNINIDKYSGDLDNQNRDIVQNKFKNNQTQILVSTCAFGMGIDKPNIRFIIHYSCPQSIEAYYQEAGRAGRDREKAICISIFSDDKIYIQRIDNKYSVPNRKSFNNNVGHVYLDEETKGAEAIEVNSNNIVNNNYDIKNDLINNNIHFNYTNYYLSTKK